MDKHRRGNTLTVTERSIDEIENGEVGVFLHNAPSIHDDLVVALQREKLSKVLLIFKLSEVKKKCFEDFKMTSMTITET